MQNRENVLIKLEKDLENLKFKKSNLLNYLDCKTGDLESYLDESLFDNCVLELQSVLGQISDCEKTIQGIKNISLVDNKNIRVGNLIRLKRAKQIKQYCITKDYEYSNDKIGFIQCESPLGKKLLNSKLGQKVDFSLNGTSTKYQIME